MRSENIFITKNLPEILSDEELNYYFREFHKGDKNAKKIIAEHNIRLVEDIVLTKFRNTQYDMQDLTSTGMIGLLKSIDTFNSNKNIKFITYAYKCITNEILMHLRKEKKYIKHCSIDEEIKVYNDNIFPLSEILADPNTNITEKYEEKELYERINDIVDNLDNKNKKIICMHFGFNTDIISKQSDIANEINISQSYLSRVERKTLNTIKRQLTKEGLLEKNSNAKEKVLKKSQNKF